MFKNKTNILLLSSTLAVFLGIYIYFANVQPVVPWSFDCWKALSWLNSSVFPVTHNNDPGRVTPKIIGPLAGHIAAFIVYPLTKDYLLAITSTVAALIATLMATFYYFSYRFFYSFSNNKVLSVCVSLLFIIFHFSMFKSESTNNLYLLWNYSLSTVFHYMIPNLINSILVFWLWEKRMRDPIPFKWGYANGIVICLLYFSMFSMLWGAVILACYAFLDLLSKLVFSVRRTRVLGGG
jgi:hypothetical protein